MRAGGIDEPRFLVAYRRELAHFAALTGPRTVSSIFFGGGTPSLMEPSTVAEILGLVARLWSLPADAEVTLEANPGSVEASRFAGYRAAGVNRVSIGVQSLREADLAALGRLHSVADAKAALDIAARTFERMSFDLIYARPRQTSADWRTELEEALALARGHLSLYQLTLEPGTPFTALHAAGKLEMPSPELASELYEMTEQMTQEAGIPAYEVSNYAAPGQEARHNLLYWRYGEYVGAGPGAHGRLLVGNERRATLTERTPEAWLARVERQGTGAIEDAVLSRAEQADELLLMGLRLTEGVDLERLARIGGVHPDHASVLALERLGLIERASAGRRLRATARGRLVLNTVVALLSAGFVPRH